MLNAFTAIKDRWAIAFLGFYWFILTLIFLQGWWIRSSLPSIPLMDPDTYGYLSPAVQMLAIGTHLPTFRSCLYPFFLTTVLRVSPNLDAIPFVQHIFGLVAAALIVLIIFRSRAFLPPGKILDWGVRFIALLGAYAFLFSRSTITLEHSIRPEGLFPTACAVTMLAGLEFCRRAFLENRWDWLASLWAFFLIISAVGNFYLKPAWGFAIGTSLLPLVLAWLWIPNKWLWKWGVLFLSVLVVFVVWILPQHSLSKKISLRGNWFLPATLLCAHAEILYPIIQNDALRLPVESKAKTHLLAFVQDVRSAMLNPSEYRYGFMLNPDDLLYHGPIRKIKNMLEDNSADFSRFCYYYYFRGWLELPVAMLGKVMKQMWFFYSPNKKNIYDRHLGLHLQEMYRGSLESLLEHSYPFWSPLDHYRNSLQTLNFPRKKNISIPSTARKFFTLWLNPTFLPLLLLSLAGVAVVFFMRGRFLQLRPAAFCLIYLSSFNFANALTISVIHMMDIDRYHYNLIAMSLVSQAFAFLFLVALVQVCIRCWKSSRHAMAST